MSTVLRLAETWIPTRHGRFRAIGYRDVGTGVEQLAMVSPRGLEEGSPLVRLHSECLTGEAFGSLRCDCGRQLDRSLARVAAEGGVVVHLSGHEGRGVGLVNKLRAYALQDKGVDTVDAQLELGLPVDAREYSVGAAILADLGLGSVRLLTNNPWKVQAMRSLGVEVSAVEGLGTAPQRDNTAYLRTKRDRLGHVGLTLVKSFEQLYSELGEKAATRPEGSGTVVALDAGVHSIGKKIVEEAAEVWMAAEHEGKDRTAEEISQLLYHLQVLMHAKGLTLDDVYAHL